MDVEAALAGALHDNPADETPWLALADWFEDHADPRADLVRLHRSLRADLPEDEHVRRQAQLQELIADGVRPWVPQITNSIGLELALIPPGSFWMGSPEGEAGRYHDESPHHRVRITCPFYLGVFAVTQAEFARVLGHNPSWFSPHGGGADSVKGTDNGLLPADNVSWDTARDFCDALSRLPAEKKAGRLYRLPTEAEWEYACRAWTTTAFHFGSWLTYKDANFSDVHCPRRPTAVGSYLPNPFGLWDMHGNVWEWCADWWGEH